MTINERAAQIAPILMIAAQKNVILTYDDIYKVTGMNRAGIGKVLEVIKKTCEDRNFPVLTSIVVRKGDGQAGHNEINENFQQHMINTFNHDWYNLGSPGFINQILEQE
jgi:hypothetical protein